MGCIQSSSASDPTSKKNFPMASGSSEIPDLELIVLRWAKEMFDATKNKEQSRVPKEFIQYNINWKHVKFHFGDPDYNMIPYIKAGMQPKNKMSKAPAEGAPKPIVQPQVLFKTIFKNCTQQEQEYSFKTERTTRSSATIVVEKGFSRGMDFQFGLKAPEEIVEANVGFKREMTLTNIGEDTVEEEMTWGVDNLVKVPPNTETTAELVITEAQCHGQFQLDSSFHGRIIVTVTNLRDNNELVTIIEGNIKDILQRELQRGMTGFRVVDNRVVVQTRGNCSFKYGVEQSIMLTQRAITGVPI